MSPNSSSTSSGLLSPPSTPPKHSHVPYITGATFIAKRHVPPEPFGRSYYEYGAESTKVPDNVSQLEWCIAQAPAPGVTHSEDRRCITISRPIRTGANCGAQVVLTDDGFIAKLYDPLYYKFYDDEYPEEKVNVTDTADKDYVIEAAAYSEFQDTPFQGNTMPKYYGSWTMDVSIAVDGQEHSREVRMILLEYVRGIRMIDVNPDAITQEERENIMFKVIEADLDLHFAGLRHDDLEPRNVILASPDSTTPLFSDPNLRVCIIDYAISKVSRTSLPSRLFCNPLFYWLGQDCYSQWHWLPPQNEATEWMWRIWGGGGKEGKYVAAERDVDHSSGKPKRPTLSDIRREREKGTVEVT